MRRTAPLTAVVLVLVGIAASSAAAESGLSTAPEYRLGPAGLDAYRLGVPGSGSDSSAKQQSLSQAPPFAGRPFAEQIDRAARDAGVDPVLVHAVVHVESRYNPTARSPKGALGLMQVLPETAARYGFAGDVLTIEGNLKAGTRYLRDLLTLFENRLELALAAYNAGENAVLRHGQRIPPYRETQQYIPAVLEKYREWQEPSPRPSQARPRIEYLPGTLLDPAARPRGRTLESG